MVKENLINQFNIKREKLLILLSSNTHPFPELNKFLENPNVFLKNRQVKNLLKEIKNKFKNMEEIPKIGRSLYRQYEIDGKRDSYENPYNKRRENLSICVFYYLLGHKEYLNIIEEYLSAICDEHTWVMPFHKGRVIDLYSADTAFTLSEIIFILKNKINPEIYNKVYESINKKIFIPYLDKTIKHKWYKNKDNWNSVCNSEIACAFLLIEKNNIRKTNAIKKALESLKVYIKESFNEDGSTEEGILYWNYGISMFVIFSEMLRASTENKIDLLNINKMKNIAKFPSKIQLSLNVFATFSDISETGRIFHPGIIERLSKRTNEKFLLSLITNTSKLDWFGISNLLRYILWWSGKTTEKIKIDDSILPNVGITKLTKNEIRIITKTGNNGESHNHNDVGSFILNVSGENFITDPGAGLYSKGYHDYHNSKRYENIFTNSYGHSVPRIDNKLQSAGKEFSGKILSIKKENNSKSVNMEMSNAYNIPKVKRLIRKILVNDGNVILEDEYLFSGNSLKIEEAFITWLDVVVKNNIAIISGENNKIALMIKEPINTKINLEKLEKESKENKKLKILKRISFAIPETKSNKVHIKVEIKLMN
jgi:hypothetical protein